MAEGGFSSARVAQLNRVMETHVSRGALPGLVTAISRGGEAHVNAIGSAALGGARMQSDSIFRLDSLTKPICAVGAMILVEECRLRLDDPVDELLPELADRKVLREIDGPLADTVPAKRAITLRDLLTLRIGLGYIMARSSDWPIQQAVNELPLLKGFPKAGDRPANDEWLRAVGSLPLMHQPGEKWMYDLGMDVLGVLIARASGKSLAAFLAERIFEPLGMKDTGFHVPEAKLDRLTTSYMGGDKPGELRLHDGAPDSAWRHAPAFCAAASGLVSTAEDVLAFAQMMLNRGKHGRHRVLARPTIDAMSVDQITPEQKQISPFFPGFWANTGWCLGFSIVTGPDSTPALPGRCGWDGGLGTSCYWDARERCAGVLLTQLAVTSPDAQAIRQDFWTSLYQAIDD